jgi:hypothetical protein
LSRVRQIMVSTASGARLRRALDRTLRVIGPPPK